MSCSPIEEFEQIHHNKLVNLECRLEFVTNVLKRIDLHNHAFRAGIAGGRVYIQAGIAAGGPRDYSDPFVNSQKPFTSTTAQNTLWFWSRLWYLPEQRLEVQDVAREAFAVARAMAERHLERTYTFDGASIFWKGR